MFWAIGSVIILGIGIAIFLYFDDHNNHKPNAVVTP